MNIELLKIKLEAAIAAASKKETGDTGNLNIPHHFWLAVTNSIVQLMGENKEINWKALQNVFADYTKPSVVHTLFEHHYLHPGEYDELNKMASFETYRDQPVIQKLTRDVATKLHEEVGAVFGVQVRYIPLSMSVETEKDLPFTEGTKFSVFTTAFERAEVSGKEGKESSTEKDECWIPKPAEVYWYIEDLYEQAGAYKSVWYSTSEDLALLREGNVYRTKAAAIKALSETL